MEEKKSGQKGVLQVAFLQVILKEVLLHYYSMQLSAHVQHFVLHCRSRVPDIHMNPHHPVMASKSPSITLKPRKWCENRRGGRDMNSQRKIPDTAYFSMYSMWLRYTYQVMMYTTISHFPHKVWSTYRIRDRSVWRAGQAIVKPPRLSSLCYDDILLFFLWDKNLKDAPPGFEPRHTHLFVSVQHLKTHYFFCLVDALNY